MRQQPSEISSGLVPYPALCCIENVTRHQQERLTENQQCSVLSMQELHEENRNALPNIFTDSIDILRLRGLQTRGLFLGCAEERKVRLLERAWDQGQNPLRLAKVQDCYAVSLASEVATLQLLSAYDMCVAAFALLKATSHCCCEWLSKCMADIHPSLCRWQKAFSDGSAPCRIPSSPASCSGHSCASGTATASQRASRSCTTSSSRQAASLPSPRPTAPLNSVVLLSSDCSPIWPSVVG